jgi:hypothetical protein
MGSASDRSPDPTRTTNRAHPPLPTGPRGTASALSSCASPPSGRQPKLLDRLRDTLHARQYSPQTEQDYPRTMLPDAVEGPLREHLARVPQIHQQDLAEGYGSDSSVENARRHKMRGPPLGRRSDRRVAPQSKFTHFVASRCAVLISWCRRNVDLPGVSCAGSWRKSREISAACPQEGGGCC